MNDIDQYAPTRGPIPWKMIAIIGGTIVLVVLIIFGARWLITSKTEVGKRAETIERMSSELDSSLMACEKEKNSERCASQKVETAALQIEEAELCNKLDGQAANSCLWKVAKQKKDSEVCDFFSDEATVKNCQDSIWRDLAGNNLDLSWCEKMNSDLNKNRCVSTVSLQIASEKGCQDTGIEQSVCDDLNALGAAIATEDPAECWLLSNTNDQSSCLDSVGPGDKDHDDLDSIFEKSLGTSDESTDSDSDGLSDYDEYYKYGTNPAKADTDGDGYADKVELDNGYDPLKK